MVDNVTGQVTMSLNVNYNYQTLCDVTKDSEYFGRGTDNAFVAFTMTQGIVTLQNCVYKSICPKLIVYISLSIPSSLYTQV